MNKKIYTFFVIALLFMLSFGLISDINVKSQSEKSLYLITSPSDYEKFGFDDLGIYYTPESLTEFHMPFIVDTDFLKIKDKSSLSGDVEIKTKNFNNRFYNYDFDILKINKQYAVIDYFMTVKASTECFNVDFVPMINDVSFKEYAWWNSTWRMNKIYTINHSMIDNELFNFPVLVKIPSGIGAYCDGGNSIRFLGMDNLTEYSFEFDVWNSSSESLVWVKIPFICSDYNTNFIMYYYNPDAVSSEDAVNVWDDSFVMIQHMNDNTTSDILDSTSYNNDGTKKGANEPLINTSGIIGNSQDFNGSCYINCGKKTSLNDNTTDLTISLWFNAKDEGINGYGRIIYKTYCDIYFLGIGTKNIRFYNYLNSVWKKSDTIGDAVAFDTLYNYVSVYDHISIKSYLNTILYVGDNCADVYNDHSGFDLLIGDKSSFDRGFNGSIDEVRISNVARSASWVKAGYENVVNYSAFMSASNVHYFESGDTVIDGELDVEISFNETQFIIFILIILFCMFIWIGYKIPDLVGERKSLHHIPFSGGLFIIFGALDFISLAILLTTNYSLGIIGGFLVTIGIILLLYGVLKAFYYE